MVRIASKINGGWNAAIYYKFYPIWNSVLFDLSLFSRGICDFGDLGK